jgi:hypothetical protein
MILATCFVHSLLTIINHQEPGFAFVCNQALILVALPHWLIDWCCCERKLPGRLQKRDKELSFLGYLNLSLTQILFTTLSIIYKHIKLKLIHAVLPVSLALNNQDPRGTDTVQHHTTRKCASFPFSFISLIGGSTVRRQPALLVIGVD